MGFKLDVLFDELESVFMLVDRVTSCFRKHVTHTSKERRQDDGTEC